MTPLVLSLCSMMPAPTATDFRVCSRYIATAGQIHPTTLRIARTSAHISVENSPDCWALGSSWFLLVVTVNNLIESTAGFTVRSYIIKMQIFLQN
ncbi:hypothetical protein K438DRAFT_1799041 [Mycena galopus ATCC 62051]|nr:hypothetical protein K438DRAFT_1799041 [Mycena galopus ATCC 62051]